jgi:hypothetical protein
LVRQSQGHTGISRSVADRFASGLAQFNSGHDELFAESPIDAVVMIHVKRVVSMACAAPSGEHKRLHSEIWSGSRAASDGLDRSNARTAQCSRLTADGIAQSFDRDVGIAGDLVLVTLRNSVVSHARRVRVGLSTSDKQS